MRYTPREILLHSFLFRGIDEEAATRSINAFRISEQIFAKGAVIFAPHKFERKIGFVTSGECLISRPSSGQPIPINVVKAGESFGITTVFSDSDEFPTLITAKSRCSIFFIDSADLINIMQSNNAVSLNVIKFLTRRIEFLNGRIAAFSATNVEEKLINYVLTLYKRYGTTEFPFNKKQSAEAMSCGRASLYRAMDSLSSRGLVRFDSKKIYITDPNGLERMLK